MSRTVESSEGLALGGVGAVGELRFRVPAVAWTLDPASGVAPPEFDLRLSPGAPSPVGTRALHLASEGGRLELVYAVAAPEVSGRTGFAVRAGTKSWIVHPPLDAATWEGLIADAPELVVLGNARALYAEGERFATTVRELRHRLGGRPLIWAPRVALPHRLALLAYLGIDLVDTTAGAWAASEGERYDPTLGLFPAGATDQPTECDCAACSGLTAATPAAHLAATYGPELRRVRHALRRGRLRELVEARLSAEPALAEHLRYTDLELGPLLEERTPVVGDGIRSYVLRESLRRPEIVRFVRRFAERYRPPPSKEVLLVLPCSKTKPYRNSPSHRRYLRALEGLGPMERLHVVSITSPLGIVPRELEDVYPCRNYDIPVTGVWDEVERERVVAGLRHLLVHGAYRRIVCHLDPAEYGFVGAAFSANRPPVWTALDARLGSPDALAALRGAVDDALRETTPVAGGPLTVVRESLREVAAYQFGRDAAERLFAPPVRLYGRPWFQRLQDGERRDLATLREERGIFQLTVAGGARLLAGPTLAVHVQPDVRLSGDLFAPGVVRADPEIRRGDAVLLVQDGRLAGVGEAELSGPLMERIGHGRAVEVRHRAHDAAPTGT